MAPPFASYPGNPQSPVEFLTNVLHQLGDQSDIPFDPNLPAEQKNQLEVELITRIHQLTEKQEEINNYYQREIEALKQQLYTIHSLQTDILNPRTTGQNPPIQE